MKATDNSDRIANELLETARALSKHRLLSAQELSQVKVLCTPLRLIQQRRLWKFGHREQR